MQERDLLSVLRLVALALDKHPTIFAGGQRGAVARLFARLLPLCTEPTRSRSWPCCAALLVRITSALLCSAQLVKHSARLLMSVGDFQCGAYRIRPASATCSGQKRAGYTLPLQLLVSLAVCQHVQGGASASHGRGDQDCESGGEHRR